MDAKPTLYSSDTKHQPSTDRQEGKNVNSEGFINDNIKRWVKHLALTLTIASVLCACSTIESGNSQETLVLSPMEAQQVAIDVVSILVNHYPRGKTLFYINRSKSHDILGRAMEKQLLKAGFGLFLDAEDKPIDTLSLTYFLDKLGSPDSYRVDIRIEPSYRIGMLYRMNSSGNRVRSGTTVRDDSYLTSESKKIDFYQVQDYAKNKAKKNKITLANNTLIPKPVRREKEKRESVGNTITWAVQVMSLTRSAPRVLREHKRRIEAMGYRAYIASVDGARKLRVGAFESLAITRKVLQQMRVNGYPDAFLWKQNEKG
jgi:hypothetical protein